MRNRKMTAGLVTAAGVAIVMSFLIAKSHVGGPEAPETLAAKIEDLSRPASAGDSAEDRRLAEEQAAKELLSEFDAHIARVMSGDDTLTGSERMNIEYKLQMAVEHSPALRAALKKRLHDAFRGQEITALMELERAFNVTEPGVIALIDLYAEEAKSGGPLDYYALQNASYFPRAIGEDAREALFQSAFSQMQKYDEHSKYNGAMLYFSSMARSGLPIPEGYKLKAIGLIQDKLYTASEGDDQYFAAQNLYKMMSAQDSAKHAASVLQRLPTFPVAQATLEAMVHGRMTVDPALIQRLIGVAAQGNLSQDQSRRLQELLAQVPTAPAKGSTGGAG